MASKRNIIFGNGEIYHIFNRSIARESIFSSIFNLNKILETIEFYKYLQSMKLSEFRKLPSEAKKEYLLESDNKVPLVEIYAFAFMPNHYHLLLKQIQEKGIYRFISNIQNSFAKHFNIKTFQY